MSLKKQFIRKLDQLWLWRSGGVRSLVSGPGRPKIFTRAMREQRIRELQEIATDLLWRRTGKRELERLVVHQHWRQILGYGLDARYWAMTRNFEAILTYPIVYSFWKGKKCLYVGKGRSWRRLANYKKSVYLRDATRLRVVEIKNKSHLPKAECLLTHLYEPRDRKVKPADTKWGKKCPVCQAHDQIREELRSLLAMR